MDPIGLGLENFDWMGRWRDQHSDGRPVDASGALPIGETFDWPGRVAGAAVGAQGRFRSPVGQPDAGIRHRARSPRTAINAPLRAFWTT